MSFGKNKKNFSKGRKGIKKKTGDRFQKKEWWTVKAPGMFTNRLFTKTPVNQTQGKTYASDSIKGRIFEISIGDLNPSSTKTYQKVKLIVDEATESGSKECLTNFYGMTTTRDHLCSLIRKWHTMIETFVDVKTNDGFLLRFFVIAFTKKQEKQQKATCYAQISQIKSIRKKMKDVITKEVTKITLKELVGRLTSETIPKEIEKECKKIFPINNCIIRKVKTIKRARFDVTQLHSMQAEVLNKPKEAEEEVKKEAGSENLLNK